jgi:hypothetical protein
MQPNQTGDAVNLQIVATDAAGYTLSYSASNLPDGLDIDPVLGVISGTIADDAASTKAYDVTVLVDDGVGETTSVTFPWMVNPSSLSAGSGSDGSG